MLKEEEVLDESHQRHLDLLVQRKQVIRENNFKKVQKSNKRVFSEKKVQSPETKEDPLIAKVGLS